MNKFIDDNYILSWKRSFIISTATNLSKMSGLCFPEPSYVLDFSCNVFTAFVSFLVVLNCLNFKLLIHHGMSSGEYMRAQIVYMVNLESKLFKARQ